MKFPLATINKTEYLEKIKALLEDEECQIFFDTNIYALFFKIYSSARQEFFSWVNELHEKQRVHSPQWIVNEYTNRFVRDQIEDYYSPLKKISTTQKELKEISSFLKMNIDSASLQGTTYPDSQSYVNDLNLIEETFKKIAKATKTKDKIYKNTIHEEIRQTFEKTIIKSDLKIVFDTINTIGGFRYNHKFPPGFGDDIKKLNEYGDLIIWHEILDFCKSKAKKKAILITNDNKKDWMYAPSTLVEGARTIPNTQPFLNIADPRLVFEFFQHTESEEFYIINFETLIKILINNYSGRFIELARALQIVFEQSQTVSQTDEDVSNNEVVPDAVAEPLVDYKTPVAIAQTELVLQYSPNALADSEFPLEDNSFLTETILELKSANWYRQNSALVNFIKNINPDVEKSQELADALFVLGRNIYQAACGGAYVPHDYIGILQLHFVSYSPFLSNSLYSGMLYEVYFNSHNKFRFERFKATFINELFKLQSDDDFAPAIKFINDALNVYKNWLFVLPSQQPEKVKVDIKFSQVKDESLAIFDITEYYNLITSIEINGHSVLSENADDFAEFFYRFEGKVDILLHQLSIFYLIPVSQMNVEFSSKENLELNFAMTKGFNFKKISAVLDGF